MTENTVSPPDPEVQNARRVAWVMAQAEYSIGINSCDLPLSARLENILQESMVKPWAIDPQTFSILYKLALVRR
jgi:hypothetical protein